MKSTRSSIASRLALILIPVALSGCSTWSASDVSNVKAADVAPVKTAPNQVLVTEADITDRPYTVLGDISVTVNKTTIFNADPTREMVNDKLREQAANLGADAVIFVRYGTAGISMMSWGSLDGKGRAIKFTR